MEFNVLSAKGDVKQKRWEEIISHHPKIVLYFYPKDNTPGCSTEAKEFSALAKEFEKLGWKVIGVSKDSIESHKKFKEKLNITIPLISDPDLYLHKNFWAWGTKKRFGKEVEGTIRSTFLIKDWEIIKQRKNVRAAWHAQKVLDYIKKEGI